MTYSRTMPDDLPLGVMSSRPTPAPAPASPPAPVPVAPGVVRYHDGRFGTDLPLPKLEEPARDATKTAELLRISKEISNFQKVFSGHFRKMAMEKLIKEYKNDITEPKVVASPEDLQQITTRYFWGKASIEYIADSLKSGKPGLFTDAFIARQKSTAHQDSDTTLPSLPPITFADIAEDDE